ncbi:hypothetical protein [Gaiella sp.]|jgi:hypothetical protein|uniref:hypothetical protein n=1 Tax=Gaiella sp. TaxID=2663207 RepID=UPI002E36CC33|nr:hypothetical protein [Gaiella sp.]HEX5582488.1 hypothetical protein [Gaiella sp.]
MKFGALVALCMVVLGVSSAIAAPPPGKGKPPWAGKPATTGAACKPRVAVVLKGTLTSTSTTQLGMDVSHANRWGRAWAQVGTATVAVSDMTKVRRQGKKSLGDLVVGDRLLVQARACKADLLGQVAPALTVVRVVAHPAKATA